MLSHKAAQCIQGEERHNDVQKGGFRIVPVANRSGDVRVSTSRLSRPCRNRSPLAEAPRRAPHYLVTFGGRGKPPVQAGLFRDEDGERRSPASGCRHQRILIPSTREGLPNKGRGGEGHARPCGAADHRAADHRERHAPGVRRYADLGEAKGRAIAGDGGRHCEEESNRGNDDRDADGEDGELAGNDGGDASRQSNRDGADDTRAAVIGGDGGPSGDEAGQCIDGDGE
jgi:hypothetical protein